MRIRKSSGEYQIFQPEKFIQSLQNSGVPGTVARGLAEEISLKPKLHKSTQAIFSYAKSRLAQLNTKQAMRYGLKRAIMNLGPTGFPFEQYVARLLSALGYSVQTDQYVRGFCVSHEVDILARKNGQLHLFECKYHNRRGMKTDVKVALYIKARFDDIGKSFQAKEDEQRLAPKKHVQHAWLVTNTKCTTEAMKYARCANVHILSWGHPADQSLQKLIEQTKVYPITILMSLDSSMKSKLFRIGVVTIQELLTLTDMHGFTTQERKRIQELQRQARLLK